MAAQGFPEGVHPAEDDGRRRRRLRPNAADPSGLPPPLLAGVRIGGLRRRPRRRREARGPPRRSDLPRRRRRRGPVERPRPRRAPGLQGSPGRLQQAHGRRRRLLPRPRHEARPPRRPPRRVALPLPRRVAPHHPLRPHGTAHLDRQVRRRGRALARAHTQQLVRGPRTHRQSRLLTTDWLTDFQKEETDLPAFRLSVRPCDIRRRMSNYCLCPRLSSASEERKKEKTTKPRPSI
mmetsp:Transcript_25493/g.82508  ORF Transcript_25493/g.82508 Transcript_25493/m.82508 type:complete len:235 (+) Transcript_25493:3081-3785(+)